MKPKKYVYYEYERDGKARCYSTRKEKVQDAMQEGIAKFPQSDHYVKKIEMTTTTIAVMIP